MTTPPHTYIYLDAHLSLHFHTPGPPPPLSIPGVIVACWQVLSTGSEPADLRRDLAQVQCGVGGAECGVRRDLAQVQCAAKHSIQYTQQWTAGVWGGVGT